MSAPNDAPAREGSGYGNATRGNFLKSNLDDVLANVPMEGYFSASLIGDKSLFRRCAEAGVIEDEGEIGPNGGSTKIWYVPEDAREQIERLADRREDAAAQELPCGDAYRFDNVGEYVKCKTCNARFTPEEVREHNGTK